MWLLLCLFPAVTILGQRAAGDAICVPDPDVLPTPGCSVLMQRLQAQTGLKLLTEGDGYVGRDSLSTPEQYYPQEAGILEREVAHPAAKGDKPKPEELAVSGMLLGFVICIMFTLHALNHRDPEIKCYSWEILSKTITIFVSLLLFEGYNTIFANFILHRVDSINLRHMALCTWGVLQVTTWVHVVRAVVKAFRYNWASRDDEEEEDIAKGRNGCLGCPHADAECRFKAWLDLSAHLAAFAAMRTGRDLQNIPFFQQQSVFLAPIPVIVVGCLMLLLFSLTSLSQSKRDATLIDAMTEEMNVKVDEQEQEAENEMFGISVSSLVSEVAILWINAALGHGSAEHIGHVASLQAALYACLGGAVCWAVTVLVVYNRQDIPEDTRTLESAEGAQGQEGLSHHALHLIDLRSHRSFFITQMTLALCASWLIMDASGHFLMWLQSEVRGHHSTIFNVLHAVSITFTAMGCVWILDKLYDLDAGGDLADKGIICIINSLAVLIGLSWEKAFHASFAQAEYFMPESIGWMFPVVGALVMAIVVVPPWRAYILKSLLAVEEEEHQYEQSRKTARETAREPRGLGTASESSRPKIRRLLSSSRCVGKAATLAFGSAVKRIRRR